MSRSSSTAPADAVSSATHLRGQLDPASCSPAAWMLDPSCTFLNHGSFGARTRAVVEQQAEHRRAFEAEPIDWLDRRRDELIAAAKTAVGRFLRMRPDHFGFVTNASSAVCSVLRSLELTAGDEILTTDHAYGAVRRTIEYVARRSGAVPVVVDLPVPIRDQGQVLEAVGQAITPRTRLLVVDHVTSPTATVLPVVELVRRCREHGVEVLVDGAHAPGMLPLDVEAVGADWYAGNLHKWVGAPVGAAFLYASPGAARVHPPIISHFHEESFAEEFAWQGTRDITPWLTAPAAIDWMARAGGAGGWEAVRRHNDALAREAAEMLAEAWGTTVSAPPDMRGSMATVALPATWRQSADRPEALRDRLYREDRIEAPVIAVRDTWHVRVSAQLYNRPWQYAQLADRIARGPA